MPKTILSHLKGCLKGVSACGQTEFGYTTFVGDQDLRMMGIAVADGEDLDGVGQGGPALKECAPRHAFGDEHARIIVGEGFAEIGAA
ncbi:hypothetical protein JWJ90_07270 [Desulfobulbus rhabdoformis]|uniref:hypothetical protein n=1 Tax=Desulfobulbus rhabdoformis TaxID=34032 RepID=UPI001962CE9A|nr:hypothetical protein [Desulfobulbus rhabdoformis]MBM9614085.1 hypothetical protein [Desulfobulbus rhabdoformis]